MWRADLSDAGIAWNELRHLLSEDERDRAARFRFRKDGDSFAAARGVLRSLLGSHLGRHGVSLTFEYDPEGKPRLSSEISADPISFNLAHSSTLVLLAVTSGFAVGVDVEFVRESEDWQDLAARFFAPEEVAALRALPDNARSSEFFRIWTRKEAYIKGRGQGLSLPLEAFSVVGHGPHPVPTFGSADAAETARWLLKDLEPGEGFRGALAVRAGNIAVRTLRWPPEADRSA